MHFRQTGAYAQILWRILIHDIVQFTTFFVFILLAFSGCLLLSLRGEGSLEKFSESRYFFLFHDGIPNHGNITSKQKLKMNFKNVSHKLTIKKLLWILLKRSHYYIARGIACCYMYLCINLIKLHFSFFLTVRFGQSCLLEWEFWSRLKE